MVTTKFYLDTRKVLKGGQGYSLRINITQNRKIASYPLGISLTEKQWNAQTEKVVGHPEAMMYNKFIAARKIEVDTIILKLADEGKLGDMTAVQIRDYIQSVLNPKHKCPLKNHKSTLNLLIFWLLQVILLRNDLKLLLQSESDCYE